MKVKLFLVFVVFFTILSTAWASITSVDLLGLKEGSVVNLDKSTLPASLPPIYVIAADNGAATNQTTVPAKTSKISTPTPKLKAEPIKAQLKRAGEASQSDEVVAEASLTKVGNYLVGTIVADPDKANVKPNDILYVAVQGVSSEKIRVGTLSEMALIPQQENLNVVVWDDDEVDQGREHSIPVIAFKKQENSIPMLMDIETSLLSQTPIQTGFNFQSDLPYGVGQRASGKGLYDFIAKAFKFEEILAAIEDTKGELSGPDAKAGPEILEFNTFLLTTLNLPSTDYAAIVNILLESIDAFAASTGRQVIIDAWNAIRAQLVASLNTEGGQYYVTSLYYGILWNSFSSIAEGGMGQSFSEFLTSAVTALNSPVGSKEALKQVFVPLNDNLKAKFEKNLDDLAKSITYDPSNPDSINSYALLRGLINKVVIDIIELIPADDIYTTLLSLTSDCQSKNDTAVTVPSTQVTSPIGSQTTQPAEKCDADPRLPGLYIYLTTTTETHEQIKERVIAFFETVVDLLTDVHNFSDIIAKVVSRIESGEYTTDEVIDFLLKFGLIKEAPADKEAFIASVIKTLNAVKDTSRFNDGHIYVEPGTSVMGVYTDPDDSADIKINFGEIK